MSKKQILLFLLLMVTTLLLAVLSLGAALKPLVFAWALAYFCLPLFAYLEQKGVKRCYTAAIVLAIIALVMFSLLFIFVPYLVNELQLFLRDFPNTVIMVVQNVINFAGNYGVIIDLDDFSLLNFIKANMPNISSDSVLWIGGAVKNAIGNIISSVINLIALFVFPVFFFYFSIYYDRINSTIISWLPKTYVKMFFSMLREVDNVMSGYVRGQLLIASILALYYAFILKIIGLEFGMVIGFCAGIMSVIPYVGFSLGLFSSLLVAAATSFSLWNVATILLVFTVAYLLDNFCLTPYLVGAKLGLNPLSIMLVLIIGGNLFGIWGMLFIIPIAALLKKFFVCCKVEYLNSEIFKNN